MLSLPEIKESITNLSDADFSDLLKWLADLDYERWDEQLRQDIDSGKLDFLIKESRAELVQRITNVSKILN